MNKSLIVIFFLVNSVFAQKRDVVYRIAYDSYPTIGYSYGISILYLRDDNTYKCLFQKYNSRKMARKNVLRSSTDEYGKWKMNGDTLLLYDNNRHPMKFFKVDDNRIAYIIDDIEISRYYWKRIKY
ncbi:hypothetical protein [Flavobacterium sp. UBA4854]|uniref:hypothetical protein n=1 Tax=Flavobacterium sp. UBA4854 TaxID=1946548 RepID=UPI0025799B3A|nr:hypothetical protein [Flavobacterium sp. UBA4854]